MEFSFHLFNSFAKIGLKNALERTIGEIDSPPVFVCIGSDLAIGDSLGPLVGTMLQKRNLRAYLYGSLNAPVTAKEIKYLKEFVKKAHPNSKLVAIDAALGAENEKGLIKLSDHALRPGSGANKRLGDIGDVSILGILGKKSLYPYSELNLTRLSFVYKMAETIADGINEYIENFRENTSLCEESS